MATRWGGCCGSRYAICGNTQCYRRIPDAENFCAMHGGKDAPVQPPGAV